MKKYFFLIGNLIIILVTACHDSGQSLHKTTIRFYSDPPTRTLKVKGEREITDINILFYNRDNHYERCFYLSGSTELAVFLPDGNYEVYALANLGSEMEELSRNLILQAKYSISNIEQLGENGTLPMVAYQTFEATQKTVDMVLKRLVARVDVSIKINNYVMEKVRFTSVRVHNLPLSMPLLEGASNLSLFGECEIPFTYTTPYTGSLSFYILENKQGTVSDITDRTERNTLKAPQNATYIALQTEKYGKYSDYRIYLGNNDTTDFNVERNTRLTYTIAVGGNSAAVTNLNLISTCVVSPIYESE